MKIRPKMKRPLREWQVSCLAKALDYLLNKDGREFLISAAPASGKTTGALEIADSLIERDEIDCVVVIAPKSDVVNDWSRDFLARTGMEMFKITGSIEDMANCGSHFCTTWSSVVNLKDEFHALCQEKKVLLIADEQHHAALDAAWGKGATGGSADAKYILILTGTPIRSDGAQTVWLAHDSNGVIDHPEEGTFTLTYGEAVDANYCRPITFHRHVGKFQVKLNDDEVVEVDSEKAVEVPKEYGRIPALANALEFSKLIKTKTYSPLGSDIPDLNGYQASMLKEGVSQLEKIRYRMPNAGGLVIANNIEMAEYMAQILEELEGEKPVLVTSKDQYAEQKIKHFRNGNQKWLVSVAMVSEGTDITRLRLLVYLPNAMTELAFRQAIGRIIRTQDHEDDTRGYVIMPNLNQFEEYARRVEDELPERFKTPTEPKTKKCKICHTENKLNAKECEECGTPFESKTKPPVLIDCPHCAMKTPINSRTCAYCGESLIAAFEVTLKDALRKGVIARGMDINEEDAVKGVEIADEVREPMLASGDESLIKIVRQLPDETFYKLAKIMNVGFQNY